MLCLGRNGSRSGPMRKFAVAALMVLLAGPAWAQTKNVPKYGEETKDKTETEKRGEKNAEEAYQRSLGNIPEQKSTDPWGTVRSDSAPKAVAKTPTAKPKAVKRDAAAKQ